MEAKTIGIIASGLAACATEVAVRGFTPAGLVGGTIALLGGGLYAAKVHDDTKVDLQYGENLDLPKAICVSLVANAVANAIFFVAAPQLTLAKVLVGTFIAALITQSKDEFITTASGLTMMAGMEVAALMAAKIIQSPVGIVTMGTGLYGLSVALILGTVSGYYYQKAADTV